MFLYSLCFAATMPLVNAVLFREVTDGAVQAKVFIWAPVAWALVGWALTGWRVTRKVTGDGSDCLYFRGGPVHCDGVGLLPAGGQRTAGDGKNPGGGSFGHAGTNELSVVHSHQHGDRRFDAVLFPRLGAVHAGSRCFERPGSGVHGPGPGCAGRGNLVLVESPDQRRRLQMDAGHWQRLLARALRDLRDRQTRAC